MRDRPAIARTFVRHATAIPETADLNTNIAPFVVGARIRPADLHGWTYTGLCGTPDRDPDAVRRYRKGEWILELRAHSNRKAPARIMTIRTFDEDEKWWTAERERRISHEPR